MRVTRVTSRKLTCLTCMRRPKALQEPRSLCKPGAKIHLDK